ncbi:glycosyltransferase family 4 protein [Tropicimonas marinistellae]|uniref:glycosyltransferase family 4 protein n=1 Tax=Tropicimonas marinistellae TaxID=1739787 RepID=UPI000A46BB38|nr:glycosyltransferase family 4 protein [Tropicimonas marinistellae]
MFFIHSLSPGGAERVTALLANHWAKIGWDVSVVTTASAAKDFYPLEPSVKRYSLDLERTRTNVAASVLANILRIRRLYRILRKAKPDVAIAMMPTSNILLSIAGKLSGTPVIGSERVHPPSMPLGRLWERLRRVFYPFLSALVAQTETSADWLRANTGTARVVVIPNPVQHPLASHSPRLPPKDCLSRLNKTKLLLAIGRLEHQKGFDLLLSAFADIQDDHPDWALVILGDGALRSELAVQIRKLDLQEVVLLPGLAGNLGEWFDAADVYVLASRFEGFPNTLLEAMAYGVPSVAVDCATGPSDIIRHDVNGLLVQQGDATALAGTLSRLMKDSRLRLRLSSKSIQVREDFSVSRVAGHWEDLVSKVLSQNETRV